MGNCLVSLAANPSPTASGSLSDASLNEGKIFPSPNLRIFTFLELKSATENFQAESLVGDGGFGGVYKGLIGETVVAVKKLNAKSSEGFQDWESEVSFLGRIYHPNLVKLLGYCWEGKELILVYEYIPMGSLETHLFSRDSSVTPLTWDLRLNIAIGAARGLYFLHITKQVIYRDFKTSNILLDERYNVKLSDFGLAKTRMHGYAASEFVSTGNLYVKNDVYGFGVVLVEILTGLRALDANRPSEQFSLVNWVTPFLSDRRKLRKVMDPRLKGKYPLDSALQTARLALKCLGLEPKTRPSMEIVLETLEEIESTSKKPKELDMFLVRKHTSRSLFTIVPHSINRSIGFQQCYKIQGADFWSGYHTSCKQRCTEKSISSQHGDKEGYQPNLPAFSLISATDHLQQRSCLFVSEKYVKENLYEAVLTLKALVM